MTLFHHVAAARERFRRAGVSRDQAAVDADVLARHALGWDRAEFVTRLRDQPPTSFADKYEVLIRRRERREPVHLIIGSREFWGRPFQISRDVLTPRPETELIVEEVLERFSNAAPPSLIVDVGTGCGCLAVTLALEFPTARVVATDVSAKALAVAGINAATHGMEARVRLAHAPFLADVQSDVDLIVSNPPYIPSGSAPGLPPEVKDYEPAVALFGGPDGLDVIRQLFAAAESALRPGGFLVMEFGFGQDDSLTAELTRVPGLYLDRIRGDLLDIPRVATIRRSAS